MHGCPVHTKEAQNMQTSLETTQEALAVAQVTLADTTAQLVAAQQETLGVQGRLHGTFMVASFCCGCFDGAQARHPNPMSGSPFPPPHTPKESAM